MRPATSPRGALVGFAALVAAACSGPPVDAPGSEPWPEPIDVRIAILLRGDKVESVAALASDAAFRATLELAEGQPGQLWLVGYTTSALRLEFPGLPASPSEIAAALAPRVDDAPAPALPPPSAVLVSTLDRAGGPLSYARASLSALETRLPPGVRPHLSVDPAIACQGFDIRTIPLESGVTPLGIAVASATAAVVAQQRVGSDQLELRALIGDRVQPLPDGPERAPLAIIQTTNYPLTARLVWDRLNRRAAGVDGRGELFTVTLGGSHEAPYPRPPAGVGRGAELAIGADGRTYASFYTPRPEGGTDSPTVYALEGAEWQVPRSLGMPFDVTTRGMVRVARRGRVIFYQGCWILGPETVAEELWSQGGYDPRCTRQHYVTIQDADIDDELAINVGLASHVGTSSAASPPKGWELYPQPGLRRFSRVIAVGGRRAVISTDQGALLVFRDGKTCELGNLLGAPATAAGGDPRSGIAYFGAARPDGSAVLVRIGVPVR